MKGAGQEKNSVEKHRSGHFPRADLGFASVGPWLLHFEPYFSTLFPEDVRFWLGSTLLSSHWTRATANALGAREHVSSSIPCQDAAIRAHVLSALEHIACRRRWVGIDGRKGKGHSTLWERTCGRPVRRSPQGGNAVSTWPAMLGKAVSFKCLRWNGLRSEPANLETFRM